MRGIGTLHPAPSSGPVGQPSSESCRPRTSSSEFLFPSLVLLFSFYFRWRQNRLLPFQILYLRPTFYCGSQSIRQSVNLDLGLQFQKKILYCVDLGYSKDNTP